MEVVERAMGGVCLAILTGLWAWMAWEFLPGLVRERERAMVAIFAASGSVIAGIWIAAGTGG